MKPFQQQSIALRRISYGAAALAIALSVSMSALAQDADNAGYVKPILPPSQVDEFSIQRVTERIDDLTKKAELFRKVVETLNADFDGTPGQAARITLIKMKVLEGAAQSVPLAAGAIENYRMNALIARNLNESEEVVIRDQISALDNEIDVLASDLAPESGQLRSSHEAVLLAKKLERRDGLNDDLASFRDQRKHIDQSLLHLRKIESGAQLFAKLAEEEVLRQRDAIRRNRLTATSQVLQSHAASLANSLKSFSTEQFDFGPEQKAIFAKADLLPEKVPQPEPKLSQEMEQRILKLLKKRKVPRSARTLLNHTRYQGKLK